MTNASATTQLYSRLGFSHHYRTLGRDELLFVLDRHWKRLGRTLDPDDFTDTQAIAATERITRGNFRCMLRTPQRDTHLHVYAPGRAEARDYLDLRDWLRVSSDDRTRYANVKRHLAQKQWNDMNDYADAKTDVVLDILTRARTWRASARPIEA